MKEEVPDIYKAGIITAIGILVGFQVNFFTKWVLDCGDMRESDYVPLFFLLSGIGLQIVSLFRSLNPNPTSFSSYKKTSWLIVIGIVDFFIGILCVMFCNQ